MPATLDTFWANLAHYLAAQGIGTAGTTLFVGQIDSKVLLSTLVVLVTPTGGRERDAERGVEYPSAQILARGPSYADAYTKITDAYYLLAGLKNNPVCMGATPGSKSRVVTASPRQAPFSLGQDAQQAWHLAFNVEFTLSESS